MRKKWIVLLSLLLVAILSFPISVAIADDPPSPSDTVTLHVYKLWDETPVQHTLAYNANGGTGAPAPQTAYKDTLIGISSITPVRDSYVFRGWSEQSDASSPEYQPGDTILMDSSKTLYAVWQGIGTITVIHRDKDTKDILDTSTDTVFVGGYGPYNANTYAGYEPGVLAAESDPAVGIINAGEAKVIIYEYKLLIMYTITYIPNHPAGTSIPTYIDTVPAGSRYTIVNAMNLDYPQLYYECVEWNFRANGLGKRYDFGDTIEITEDLILYGKWAPRI